MSDYDYEDGDGSFTVKLIVHDAEGSTTKQFTLPYDESWTTVMAKLADGLSAHYGYNIKEDIRFIVTHPECHTGPVRDLCIDKQAFIKSKL